MEMEEPEVTGRVKYGTLGGLNTLNCIYDFNEKPIPEDDKLRQSGVSVEGSGNPSLLDTRQ
jgi:hypothetical protein